MKRIWLILILTMGFKCQFDPGDGQQPVDPNNNPPVEERQEKVCTLYSIPEYDGHFLHSDWRDGIPPVHRFRERIKLDGHGYEQGISGGPQLEMYYQTPFITFDLAEFEGDWSQVFDIQLRIYPVVFFPGPSTPPYPEQIEVMDWLIEDYSQLINCQITGNYCGGDTRICNSQANPEGCQFPEQVTSSIPVFLYPAGDGWYTITEDHDVMILHELFQNLSSLEHIQDKKISFWLDLPQWVYIKDETSLTPPELTIHYYE